MAENTSRVTARVSNDDVGVGECAVESSPFDSVIRSNVYLAKWFRM